MLRIDKKCGKKVVKNQLRNLYRVGLRHQEARQLPAVILIP